LRRKRSALARIAPARVWREIESKTPGGSESDMRSRVV